MQKELQNMRIQYVEKERADKSNRIELKEMQIKVPLSHFGYFLLDNGNITSYWFGKYKLGGTKYLNIRTGNLSFAYFEKRFK